MRIYKITCSCTPVSNSVHAIAHHETCEYVNYFQEHSMRGAMSAAEIFHQRFDGNIPDGYVTSVVVISAKDCGHIANAKQK